MTAKERALEDNVNQRLGLVLGVFDSYGKNHLILIRQVDIMVTEPYETALIHDTFWPMLTHDRWRAEPDGLRWVGKAINLVDEAEKCDILNHILKEKAKYER